MQKFNEDEDQFWNIWKTKKEKPRQTKTFRTSLPSILGAEGSYLDSHHDSSPNNGESFKYPRKFDSHEMFGEMQLDPKYPGSARLGILPNYRNASSLSSINAFIGPPRAANISDEWLKSRNNMRHPPSEYDRTLKGDRLTNPNHQLTYHNMFTPSQEPGTLWRCRSCGKEVTNRWHHFHSHTAQRSMCPYCPATYSRIDTLRSHLKQKHKNEPQLKNWSLMWRDETNEEKIANPSALTVNEFLWRKREILYGNPTKPQSLVELNY